MTRRLTTFLLAAAVAAAMLAATAGGGAAATATSASAASRVVPIVMKDPGCHWFQVGGKLKARLAVAGKTVFRNLDEDALIFKGKHFNRRVAVGKSVTVSAPGVYRITMVNQHPHDNTLVLVVK